MLKLEDIVVLIAAATLAGMLGWSIFVWPKAFYEYPWRVRLRLSNPFSRRWSLGVRPEHVSQLRSARRKTAVAYSVIVLIALGGHVWERVRVQRFERELELDAVRSKEFYEQWSRRAQARAAASRRPPASAGEPASSASSAP